MVIISFSERVQRVIVEEGHRAGMTVQTHTTSVESLDMAIEAGVDIITHGDISGPVVPIPMETVRKLVELDIAVSVLPITQRRLEALQQHNPDGTLTPYMAIGRENQTRMIEAGVSMLLSTDAGIKHPVLLAESGTIASDTVDQRTKLGEGHFNALAALEELGMAPMEILRSATSHIARAYEMEDEIGSLQAGMIADLVILDANPLDAARNYRSIHAVIKDGQRVDLDALPVAPIISALKPDG
ncbi:amidohydrolase family protein [Candidatus Palauibacter sp.]|uniref:amidohydrolase family protein n=1 Tax=Candidatus Palauibacter sp. TaxID=3101350 RepID=UPI003CC54844